ncbi:hypothetical protein KC316_g5059 [Hortaea werneckii]|nr:hypothetical protein KC324_g5153 [Hortaea werneckii]KAI7587434.1 hypothetical protein KC316_g5059 [Hortaea werneckii]
MVASHLPKQGAPQPDTSKPRPTKPSTLNSKLARTSNSSEICLARVYLDGDEVASTLILRDAVEDFPRPAAFCNIEGVTSAIDRVQRFLFADLRTVVDDVSAGERDFSQLGTIAIELYHDMNEGKIEEQVDFQASQRSAIPEEIVERKLKGQALSNGVSFKESEKVASPFNYSCASMIPNQPAPFAIFVFKYRSPEDLRNLDILPRPAPAVPLHLRDHKTLSPEEIAELQQMVIAAQADDVKIKRESAESSERPGKRARTLQPADQSEVIEIDDD